MIDLIPTPELVTPGEEPLSLDDLKLYLRVDSIDEDDVITSLAVAARQWFEAALDRQLTTATWRVKWAAWPSWRIELPYPPLASVTTVKYRDLAGTLQTVATSVYDVITYRTPGVVQTQNGQAWPPAGVYPDAVQITYVAGYGAAATVPDLVKSGIKLLASHWYKNRESAVAGVMSEIPQGVSWIATTARAHRF